MGVTADGVLSAQVAVEYPGSSTQGMLTVPHLVRVVEQVDHHVSAVITHGGTPSFFRTSLLTGSPVEIRTSSRIGIRSWFGYVVDVRPTDDAGKGMGSTDVHVLGVTFPLRETSLQVHGPESVAETLRRLIYSCGLLPFVEDVPGVVHTTPQAGRTGFEVVRALARDYGLHVFCTGTTVNVLSKETSAAAFHGDAALVLREHKTDERATADAMDRVENISSQTGRTRAEARVVNPADVSVSFAAYGQGRYVQHGAVGRTPVSAGEKVRGAASRDESPYRMRAQGPGNMAVGAGKPVYVDNRGDRRWWYTDKVVHTFSPTTGGHSMDVLMSRDWEDLPYPRPSAVPARGTSRTLQTGVCTCQEHNPLLVPASKANFITAADKQAVGVPRMTPPPDVAEWLAASPVPGSSPSGMYPYGGWADLDRWRARGRCS